MSSSSYPSCLSCSSCHHPDIRETFTRQAYPRLTRASDALYECNVFLDDFGAERFKYGDEDMVGNFICRYYDRHNPYRVLMVSTNLDGAGIDAKYGGRVFDRLREECVILPMSGGSKRKEIIIK